MVLVNIWAISQDPALLSLCKDAERVSGRLPEPDANEGCRNYVRETQRDGHERQRKSKNNMSGHGFRLRYDLKDGRRC